MRKIFFIFCFLAAVCMPVVVLSQQCDDIQVPWIENFGTYQNSNVADCWIVDRQGIGQARINANNLQFSLQATDKFMVALPAVALPPDSVYFRFHAKYSGNLDFVYGVMTDTADTNSFLLIDTLPLEANSDWIEVSFTTLGTGLTDTVHLAFKISTPTYATVQLDNFYIDRAAGCSMPVSPWTSYVDTMSATLKWHCDPPFGGFALTLNDSLQYFTPDTLIDIVNLSPNTAYNYSLRTICQEGELSPEVRGSFRTTCMAVQLPLYQDFEIYFAGATPSCWRVLRGLYTTSAQFIYPSVQIYSGNKVLELRKGDDSVVAIATPMIAYPGNALHVGFDMHLPPFTSMTVGLLYNPYDMDSFIPITSFEGAEGVVGELDHYDVYSERITDTAFAYVVFYWNSNGSATQLLLDNVVIEPTDSCHAISEVRYDIVEQNSITISWTDYSLAPQGYEVRYSTVDSVESADSVFFTTDTIFTAYNLEVNMSYYFWVRSLCYGDTVRWFPAGYVRTECGQPLLPYSEDFDSYREGEIIPCWEYYHTDYTCNDPYVRGSTVTQSFPFVWGFNVPKTDTLLVVLPSVGINARNLEVSFMLAQFNGCFEAGVYEPSNDVFTPVIRQLGNSANPITSQQFVFQCDTVEAATQFSRIAFRWYCKPGITSPSIAQAAYMDNLLVRRIPYCHPADSVDVISITNNSAVVHVYDSWNTGLYRVIYTDGHTVDTAIGYGEYINLTGLQHSTNYNISVSGFCVDGSMTDPVVGLFHTDCMTLSHDDMPYEETFDDYTDGVHINPCWKLQSYNVSYPNYPIPYQGVYYSDTATSNGVSMQFPVNCSGAYSEIMVLPQVDYTSDLYVEFMARSSNISSRIDVGIMDNPNDLSTFYRITTIAIQNIGTWTRFTVPFDGYNGSGKYIAFAAYETNLYASGNIYIDNVKLKISPPCSDSLTWLSVRDVDNMCATVLWNASPARNENAQYIVHVLDTAGNELFADTTSSMTHTICGLDNQTSYQVYVDLYCDSSIVATTTNQIGFTTQCGSNNTISIGTNANGGTTSAFMPVVLQSSTRRSLSEQLYFASEMQNTAGMITDMKLYLSSANVLQDMVMCTIRLGHTTENALRQWIPLDSLEVVYEGPLNFRQGWNALSLAKPFHYNGSDNLVVSFKAVKYGPTLNNQFLFGTRNATDSSAIFINDANVVDTVFVGYRNRVRFSICVDQPDICQPPAITSFVTGDNSITVNYSPTPCELHITRGWWSRSFTGIMDSTGSHTFEGLTPATEYTIGLRTHCANGDRSLWTIRRISTDSVNALPPLVMTLDSVTYNSVSVRWRPRASEDKWEVRLFNTVTDIRAVLTDTAYFFDGLSSMVIYHVSVRSLCGSDYSILSPWSDTLTFTTDYCHPVTDVLVTDITETSAHVTWTPSHNSVSWKLEYGYEGFLRGEAIGSYSVGTPTFELDSLEPGTSYNLYVASVCGPGMSSGWVGTDPFRTSGNSDITTTPDGMGFEVYPNPASSYVTVQIDDENPDINISVLDQQGRVVAASYGPKAVIDVSNLSTGVYFVRISGSSYHAVKKLIVK